MINIKKIKSDYTFTLHRINMDIIGEIPIEFSNDKSATVTNIGEIRFTIPKYITNRYTFKNEIFHLFNEIKEERIICIDGEACFVIKDINETDGLTKEFTARSKEVKLGKKDINLENVGLQLYTEDISDEENRILSLNKYMQEETGWSLGVVSEDIAYDISEDGIKTEKLRWQESVNSNWYDYLTKDIKEQFECVVTFDTYHKKVNLLSYDSFGDNIQLYLSHDNYIESLKQSTSTQDIVTRLFLVGSEEMDIIGGTCTGYTYIEDYSYFIDEMSKELKSQWLKYLEMLKIRDIQWRQLVKEKQIKQEELIRKNSRWTWLIGSINAKERIKETYDTNKDTINYAKTIAELTELRDEETIVKQQVLDLQTEVSKLQLSIDELNILCKRETATDENGLLIFNKDTLEELKEFVYDDTYTNDSFLEVEDLISAGKRELSLKSKPTFTWEIEVSNFLNRVIDNGFRQHWNGELSLGDIIILYDKENDKEELLYFVGYTQDFNEKTLKLELSNKKIKDDNTITIADTLGKAESMIKTISLKKYLFIQQKYNKTKYHEEV